MSAHRWTEIEGQSFCATCGVPKGSEGGECREVEKTIPVAKIGAARETGFDVGFLANLPSRTDEELLAYRWENEILPRLADAGFSDRHRKRITDWNCKPQEMAFEKCLELCRGVGAIIALIGARGTGKTTICSQMALDRAENESLPPWDRQPPYRKLQSLVERYKPLYGNMGSVDMDALASARDWFCRTPSLAFIDEVHECEDLQIKNRLLTDILDRRYAARKDTIILSNQDEADFRRTTSDSILSRIDEHGLIIECTWESWRAKS